MAKNFTSKIEKITQDELLNDLQTVILWKAEHDAGWIEHSLSENVQKGNFTSENGKNYVKYDYKFYDRLDFQNPEKRNIDFIFILPILTTSAFERAMISNFKENLNAITLTDEYYKRSFWGNDFVGMKPQLVVDNQTPLPLFNRIINTFKSKGTQETYARFDNATQIYFAALNMKLCEKGIKISKIRIYGYEYEGINLDTTISTDYLTKPFCIGLKKETSKDEKCSLNSITIYTELEF